MYPGRSAGESGYAWKWIVEVNHRNQYNLAYKLAYVAPGS